jgi:hypothetical protein
MHTLLQTRLNALHLHMLAQVVKMLRFNGTRVPPDYEVRFQLALWAFRHCRVYCPAVKVRRLGREQPRRAYTPTLCNNTATAMHGQAAVTTNKT